MSSLTQKRCVPCSTGVDRLSGPGLARLAEQLPPGWRVVDSLRLEKDFKFTNFREAMDFTNRVGELAEAEGHHPDIHLSWGNTKLVLWTHKVGGLTESDFILAAKADGLK